VLLREALAVIHRQPAIPKVRIRDRKDIPAVDHKIDQEDDHPDEAISMAEIAGVLLVARPHPDARFLPADLLFQVVRPLRAAVAAADER